MSKRDLNKELIDLFKNPAIGITLTGHQWESVILVLRHAGLLAVFYYLAQRDSVFTDFPGYAQKHLNAARIYADRQAQQVRFECKEIASVLSEKNIYPVFLKGAGYTLRNSQNGKGRIYSDIDVLVAKEEINAAEQALNISGWYSKILTDHDQKYYRDWVHEIPPMLHSKRGTVIDVHHNILPPVSGRAPDVSLLKKSTAVLDDGLLVLSLPGAFLHSCVHLFCNEEFHNGFRDVVDLYLLVSEFANEDFWQDVVNLADKTGFKLELYYCLSVLEKRFELSIPNDIKRRLSTIRNLRTELVCKLLLSGLKPHHPLTLSKFDRLAIFLLYVRGHWIKMPLHILVSHLSIKAFLNMRDKLFGKHQFDKKTARAVVEKH